MRDGCATLRRFVHTKMVRLIVDDDMEITALEIVKSLPDFMGILLALCQILGENVSTLPSKPPKPPRDWPHLDSTMGQKENHSRSWKQKPYTYSICLCGDGIPGQGIHRYSQAIWANKDQKFTPFVLYREGLHEYRAGHMRGRIHNPQQGST